MLKSIREATHKAPLVGCSGEGVIAQGIADESNFAVTVLVVKSEEMHFTYGLERGIKASSSRVGEAVGEAVSGSVTHLEAKGESKQEAKALFLFLEGISPNFDEFMEGLRSRTTLEQSIPAVGGFAGDNLAIRETFQYCDDQVVTDGAAWALLSGGVKVSSVMSHGCMPVLEVLETYLTEAEVSDWSIAPVMLGWAFDSSGTAEAELVGQSDRNMIRAMAARNEQAGAIYMMSDCGRRQQLSNFAPRLRENL